MNAYKAVGIAIIVIAVLILRFAYNATSAPVGQFNESPINHYSDGTLWYFISGIFALLGGILLSKFNAEK